MNVPKNVRFLIATHAGVALLAVALSSLISMKTRPSREALAGLSRRPLLDAATLAFRFGERDQARPLLERSLPKDPKDYITWGDTMMIELRLAILDGEQFQETGRFQHLEKASAACQRMERSDCGRDRMRELARDLGRDPDQQGSLRPF